MVEPCVAEADGDEVKSLVATMADLTSRKLFSALYNVWMTCDVALLLFSTLYGCSIVAFDCCCRCVILQTLLLSCIDLSSPYDDGEKGNVDDDAIDDDDEALTSRHVAMMIANVRRSMIVCCGCDSRGLLE